MVNARGDDNDVQCMQSTREREYRRSVVSQVEKLRLN